MLLASCGFQLRGDPQVGVKRLYISSDVPSQVHAEIKRSLAAGSTPVVATEKESEVHLHILQENRDKNVFTITGTGRVYEFQLKITLRYEVRIPGREDPVIPPTEVIARRVVTYSESAPTAKEAEEQLLFTEMQQELAGRILRHVGSAARREM